MIIINVIMMKISQNITIFLENYEVLELGSVSMNHYLVGTVSEFQIQNFLIKMRRSNTICVPMRNQTLKDIILQFSNVSCLRSHDFN